MEDQTKVKVTVQLKQVVDLKTELSHRDKNGNRVRSVGKDFFVKNNEGEFECYHLSANTPKEQLELYIQRGVLFVFNPDTVEWSGKIKTEDNHAC